MNWGTQRQIDMVYALPETIKFDKTLLLSGNWKDDERWPHSWRDAYNVINI